MKHKKERRELNKKKVTQNIPEYMVASYFLFPCFQSWVVLKFDVRAFNSKFVGA